MIGWPVAVACFVACWLGESSQHPTWPHSRQRRRCSQGVPSRRQSSQPSVDSGSWVTWTWSRCVQFAMGGPLRLLDRDADAEHGPARLGFDGERAVVAVDDDAPGRREPEARALADVLLRQELVEDAVAD